MKKRILFKIMFAAMALTLLAFTQDDNYSYEDASSESVGDVVFKQWLWRNAEVASIFNSISERTKVDFVVDPKVIGKISLHLKKKTWREVVDVVCKMKQLIALEENQYIYILTEMDYLQRQKNRESNKQTLALMREPVREIVHLENISADSLMRPIRDVLSSRGKITVVKHTNSIIIYDVPETMNKIKNLITNLDVEVAQVSISTKIIEVSTGNLDELGVQWNLFFGGGSGTPGNVTNLPTGSVDAPATGTNLVSAALGRLTWGIIDPRMFQAAIEYFSTEDRAEIVAQPQITTLDNQEARIFMGHQIPVTYLDVAGNTNVKLIEAGTELIVTPNITGEGKIRLHIKPKKESYTMVNNVPVISEQSAETQVVVRDGETVVIAGLTFDQEIETEGGVPYLRKIPLLGNLFKRSRKDKSKKDLIIFVTPHIIKTAMTTQHDGTTSALGNTVDESIKIPSE